MTLFKKEQIDREMRVVPDWTHHGKTLVRDFKLDDFLMSIAFVRRIAKRAEKFQHHPGILIEYDRVTLTFTTEDADGLTEKDFIMAEECDKIYANFLEP